MSESDSGLFIDSAKSLRVNTSTQIIRDTVSSFEANDLYSFNIKGRSSFNVSLDGLSADADVQIIQDKNGNGKYDKGERIAYSNNGGTSDESISVDLAKGSYYIEVYPYGNIETDYRLSIRAVPFDSAGNTLNNAREVAVSQTKSISDWVGKSDSEDYYKFKLGNTSDLNVVVDGLSADADLRLLSGKGNILASSVNIGTLNEAIAQTLEAGTYYLKVNSYNNSETFYNLKLSASPSTQTNSNAGDTQLIPTSAVSNATVAATSASLVPTSTPIPQTTNTTRTQAGTLRADTFTFQSGYSRTIFSGNGNVDYSSGARDLLDLSEFDFSSATL
ncbi:MAG: pre-peptidase C-terminal domain-containing protein, partial [Rivularia sp. (in: cyanobacteria)]